jgi:superfamily II DNA helicase RecQ
MALTATANESVIMNIIDRLNIPSCVRLKQSFNRPNLRYEVRKKQKKQVLLQEIADFVKLHHANETGIIYCFKKTDCEQVARALRDQHGLNAEHYHAKVAQSQKRKTQEAWRNGTTQIIVCTVSGLI